MHNKKSYVLMIKTKDKRKFFTPQKNLPLVLEFANTFHAELYVVDAGKAETLNLKDLALAICDSNYNCDGDFEIVSKLFPKKENKRSFLLGNASTIRKYIHARLTASKAVSIKELRAKFANLGLSNSCLCNHLSAVRKEFEKNGHTISRIGAGKYVIIN